MKCYYNVSVNFYLNKKKFYSFISTRKYNFNEKIEHTSIVSNVYSQVLSLCIGPSLQNKQKQFKVLLHFPLQLALNLNADG